METKGGEWEEKNLGGQGAERKGTEPGGARRAAADQRSFKREGGAGPTGKGRGEGAQWEAGGGAMSQGRSSPGLGYQGAGLRSQSLACDGCSGYAGKRGSKAGAGPRRGLGGEARGSQDVRGLGGTRLVQSGAGRREVGGAC